MQVLVGFFFFFFVGTAAIQIAKHIIGARVITKQAGSKEKLTVL